VKDVAAERRAEDCIPERQGGRVRHGQRGLGASASLLDKAGDHRRRQIDADQRNTRRGEWEADPSRTDADLEAEAAPGHLCSNEVDDLSYRLGPIRPGLVVIAGGPVEVH
jgi:hypothetical protein